MQDVDFHRGRVRLCAKFVIAFASAAIVCHLSAVLIHLAQYGLVTKVAANGGVADADTVYWVKLCYSLFKVKKYTFFAIAALGTIAFLFWVYQSDALARALGSVNMAHGAVGSVGWFFFPVANLFRPLLVMKEILLATAMPGYYLRTERLPATTLVEIWWFLKIADLVFSSALSQFVQPGVDLEAKQKILLLLAASAACSAILASLVISVVVAFGRVQQKAVPAVKLEGHLLPA